YFVLLDLHSSLHDALPIYLGNTSIFPALVSGSCLHVLDHELAADSHAFATYALKHQIDVLKIVPSHLTGLLAADEANSIIPNKYLIIGGEVFPVSLAKRVLPDNKGCVVINHYGPTEATIGC